ncbi:hypothetical protein EV05_0061 [Prochlorococcus sp. MIT 0601]|nr:hypothetical protein EV05_0061 [Prochlorococcus sp. MIT 0601]
MLLNVLGLMRSELGVNNSTINFILIFATLMVVILPLLFVLRSKKDRREITL